MMSQTKPTVCHLNSPSQFVAQLLYGKTFTGVCFCPAYNISVPNTKQVKSHKLSKAKHYVFSVTVQLELELMTFVH